MFLRKRSSGSSARSLVGAVGVRIVAAIMVVFMGVVGGATVAKAESVAGLWRGSGFVNPSEGRRERVRCRVMYTRQSEQRYQLTARCATASANIDQVGEVRRTGRDRLSGSFYNADFNVRGRIQIRLNGNRQAVTLISDAGSGRLTLFKR
jgi:hypothetical protein